MRIGSSSVDQLGTSGTGAVGGANSDARSNAAGGAKSDSVSLSNAASLIALAKSGAGNRQEKVQNIGSQVRSGTYQADTAQVSRAVVQGHIG